MTPRETGEVFGMLDALTARVHALEQAAKDAQPETMPRPASAGVREAIDIAIKYGGIDGGHHKMWVIDQMVQVLAGDHYGEIVRKACDGEDGPDTYEWDTGIAP